MVGAKRRDKYPNFEMLRRTERGDDFRIDCRPRPTLVAIIAPHGGKIEPGSSTIAAAIAADDYCLYRFEGRKRRENRDLHITSTHFDEPECLALISGCDQMVAVHGCEGDEQAVYIGPTVSPLARRTNVRPITLIVLRNSSSERLRRMPFREKADRES